MVVIRLCCLSPTYLSKPSLICDFCPSDQRFAYSFLQIPPRDGHPCCSAIHFPLPGCVRDFHPLERAHGAQTKRAPPGAPNKAARIQYKQAALYIQLLQDNGTRLPENVTKHLSDGIWELRPGNNRVFYFYFENDTFVLLHLFRKKTPHREIDKAKAERDDYLSRKEAEKA